VPFEITQKRKFNNLMGYCSDGRNLYTLSALDHYFELSVFDGDSFKHINRFVVAYYPYIRVAPFTYKNVIFLPAVDGRIIGLDSSTNERIVDVDLGAMMVASKPHCDDEFIYSVCSIPISNRPTTDTDISVVCINDLKSGKKRGQSCVLKGRTSPLFVDNKIWAASDKALRRFSKQGEQEALAELNFVPLYPPVVTENRVFVFGGFGGIEILDLDLKPIARLMTGKNHCCPVQVDRKVFWPTEKHLCKLDLDTEKVERLTVLPSKTSKGQSVYCKEHIFAATEQEIIGFDIKHNAATSLTVGENLKNPVATKNAIFTASNSEIFQICPITR
jgi:predicted DNA-binding protein